MNTQQAFQEQEEDALELFLREGGTFAMLKGISQASLEHLYTLAFNHYQVGNWRDAHTFFQGLCALDHYDTRFFLGLGACRQRLEMFQGAIESYTYGALVDIKDPRFPFYAGECQLQLGDLDAAESGFYSARMLASAQSKYLTLERRAQGMLETVMQRRSES